ncbi:FG-GAP-like repeat-containing protein [Bernardetia sp. Wsw4-3y2]|uniref:FG-GAP-like repeat-containing protein n=1 Tax=Bernardetia sp. Wsw4-3y2 TaxID=3127471 RepID=UPI0030CD6A78
MKQPLFFEAVKAKQKVIFSIASYYLPEKEKIKKNLVYKFILFISCFIFFTQSIQAQYTELTAGGTSPLNFSNTLFELGDFRTSFPIDYDVDGDMDFLVVNTGASTWHLIRNDGGGSFSEQTGTTISLSIANATEFLTFDYDGDGDTDIYDPVKGTDGQAAIFRNDGGGTFTQLTAGGTSPLNFSNTLFELGDFRTSFPIDYDVDGDMDFLAVNTGASTWHLIRNDGGGSFSEQTGTTISLSIANATEFLTFDYDGDGDTDIYDPVKGTDGQAAIFRNDGGGTFTELTAGGTSPLNFSNTLFELGDFRTSFPIDYDVDGDMDFLAVNTGASTWHLIRNDGGGSFSEQTGTTISLSIANATEFLTFDYDGDWDIDVYDPVKGTDGQAAIFQNTNSPPALSSSTPTDGATDFPENADLVLNFNETVTLGTGNIEIRRVNDNSVVEAIDITSTTLLGATQLTINPASNLPTGIDLYIHIDAGAVIDTESEITVSLRNQPTTLNFRAILVNNPPTVTTTAQANVTATTADLGGNVTNDGGATVTERGIVWGTSTTPTTSNNKVQIGTGTGVFNQNITGLPSATTIFVRAYAINSEGTSYGNQISFTTLAPNTAPSITLQDTDLSTNSATSITFNSGNSNLISISDGEGNTQTVTIDVTGGGVFSLSTTSGLTVSGNNTASLTLSGSLVNINAALNGASFNPSSSIGQHTIAINTNDGTVSSGVSSIVIGVYPSTATSTTETFESFTNNDLTFTNAATNQNFSFTSNTFRITEFAGFGIGGSDKLFDNVANCNSTGNLTASLLIGGSSVFYTQSFWLFPSETCVVNGTNGTVIVRGKNNGVTQFTRTILSAELNDQQSINEGFTFINMDIYAGFAIDELEFQTTGSISYVGIDNLEFAAFTPPTVTTTVQANVTATTADLGGNVTNDGGATVTDRGIVWGTSTTPTTSNNKVQIGTGTGVFNQNITGLPSATTVFVRSYAINSEGTSYGNQISFTTLSACSAPTGQVSTLLAGNNPTVSTLDVVSYDAPAGGATGYVIKINSTNSFTAPTNAASLPTADLSWNDAGEQVIYAGTSTNPNIVVTGLDPSTQYFFRVYAYNDCAGTNTFETTGTGEAGTTLTLPLLAATITSISCSGGSTGAIDLDVSEFSGSQTYAWSDGGVTTQNRTGLSAGEYEVTITDGGTDYTATYEVGYDLTWTDFTEFTLVDKRLTKSTATTGWTSKAFSEEKIIANGGIAFTAEEKDAYNYMIGLSYYKGAVGYASIRYAIYLTNAGSIVVYENGVVYGVGGTFGTYQNGDIFRIERTGTTFVYSKNGTPFRTVGGVAAGDLIADATMYTPNGRIPQVQFTSCPIALEITSFTSNTCPTDGAGAATATLLGEALATTYAWSSGENTASISNKNTGIYSVTATGVYGTRTKYVAIGYEVDFENQANVSSAGNVLTKTNATGWTSGANSASTQQLAATANGWVSNTITSNTSSYMIGLAKPNTAASYTSIDYAWYFVGNSNAVPSYNKNPGTAVAYQKGDVFTVAREGSQMKFYKNGTVVHQYTINATETLVADVAINSGSTGEVQVSFCGATGGSQTYTAAVTGIDCGTGGTAGTIDITATGATYVWSNGANTANITGLSAGTYQLELTKDGITYNASYLIGAPLTWTNLTNLALNANGQLDHTSTTGWNTNANSTQKVIGNGGIVFNVDNATTSSLIGLSKKENGTAFNSIEYAIYTTSSGKVYVVEKGGNKGDFGSYQTGDGFKIERVGTTIEYSKNGSVFYTSTGVTTQDLVVDAGLYTANTTLPKVLFINCALDLSISAPLLDCGVSTGSATATVTGGTFATTYVWKNDANTTLSTTNTLSNQPAGYYTVTASGAFSSITKNVVLSYPVSFVVEADVTTSGATVNKTTGTTAWDAGVHTTNTLAANQDGFVENTVAQNISYMFGLTTQNTTPYFSSIKYRWYVLANGKAIAGYTPSSGVIIDYQVGDKLRVERVASVIKYFHNNVEITQQSIDASEELIADIAIYTPNGNAGSYKVSFCATPATRIATKVKANQNEFEQDTFSVYPNPSTGIVNVRFETALVADTQVTVFDGIGRKVSSQKFQKGKNELKINLTNQPKGMYLIHFNQNGATYSKSIIIQ